MSNLIQITNTLAIGSDQNQWMLKKPVKTKNKETGVLEETWQSFNYFSTLESCVKEAGHRLLRTANATTAKELIEASQAISTLLNQKFTANMQVEIK